MQVKYFLEITLNLTMRYFWIISLIDWQEILKTEKKI